MKKLIKRVLLSAIVMGGSTLSAKDLALLTAEGELLDIFIDSKGQFEEVVDSIGEYYQCLDNMAGHQTDQAFTLIVSNDKVTVRKKELFRDYYAPVTKQEKKDIHYIVTALAHDNLVSLGASKSSLNKAGERIEQLHPFKFLSTIFTDEELKAGIHAIRGRIAWVWDEFVGGFIRGFKEETAKKNMKNEYIKDFSSTVGIDPALIMPSIQRGEWEGLINILIDTIPRKNDPNRYNL
ncbi:MAG: hypothetical protein H0V82_10205 [Candidatus Protochlamydia sp.]|nr:hypothetical protein [Candidatus Protochlamydia sp.]